MEFIVITGPSYKIALKKIQKALKIRDGIELRLDLFHEIKKEEVGEIVDLCKSFGKKIILTLRSLEGGGNYKRSIASLEEEIFSLSATLPHYMDVEYTLSDDLFSSLQNTHIISSFHDFERTPNLDLVLKKMQRKKAYAYKVCTTPLLISDSYRMLNFIHKQKKLGLNFIGICMGEKGKITREEGLKVGNYLNYRIIHLRDKVAEGLDFA
jgi:3-dehydroquinate dehydratase type I